MSNPRVWSDPVLQSHSRRLRGGIAATTKRETILAIPTAWGPTETLGSVSDTCEECLLQAVWTDVFSQQLRQAGAGPLCIPCASAALTAADPDEVHEAYLSWVGWEQLRHNN